MNTIWPIRNLSGPTAKPASCQTCPLYGNGQGFGFPVIGGPNGVMVVVESLGEHEALQGLPLVGPAGWQFNHILKRAGLQREDFAAIDNTIHCRPPANKLAGQPYEAAAIRACAPFLDDTVVQAQPRAILAMGGIPLRRMAGVGGPITRNRGFIHNGLHNIPVIGTFHPSYLLPRKREKSAAKYTWVIIMDIRKALRVASGQRDLVPQHYLMDPSMDQAEQFVGEYEQSPVGTKLAWDLETLYKMKVRNEQKLKLENRQTVTRVSFAFRPGYAMSIPYDPLHRTRIIDRLMRAHRPKVGWNSKGFDEPIVLFQEGWEVNGVLLDGMDHFHVFQPNIERNLEFASSLLTDHLTPWKHLSQAEPEFYSCVDADATITDELRLDAIMSSIRIPEYPDAPERVELSHHV
jgi:uracil-DNA glycosylase family 4